MPAYLLRQIIGNFLTLAKKLTKKFSNVDVKFFNEADFQKCKTLKDKITKNILKT